MDTRIHHGIAIHIVCLFLSLHLIELRYGLMDEPILLNVERCNVIDESSEIPYIKRDLPALHVILTLLSKTLEL